MDRHAVVGAYPIRVLAAWVMRLLLAIALGPVSVAMAQVGAVGGLGAPSLAPSPVGTGRADIFARPGRIETALIAGDWLLYPSVFGGGIYDSNVNQSATAVRSSVGLRLSPSLLAETNNGIVKTSLYGLADGRLYFSDKAGGGDAISINTGASEIYQPLSDLRFTGQANYTRQKDLFSTLGTSSNLLPVNTSGVGLAPTTNPLTYNQISGAASVQKNFASAFVILGGSVVDIMYEHGKGAIASSPDGVTYTGTTRGGLWLTPALYGYLEGSFDTRDYSISTFNSSGYRVVGGLGTDQIGLFRGEAFGGFQSEKFKSGGIGTADGAVFGTRVHYYPLPELTVNLAVDESIGASLLAATPTSPAGTSTKLTSVVGTADYAIAREWGATGRAGYIHTDYGGSPRRDDAWTLGTTLTYNLSRNAGLTLDFQHIELHSNVAFQSFSREIVSLGLTYRY